MTPIKAEQRPMPALTVEPSSDSLPTFPDPGTHLKVESQSPDGSKPVARAMLGAEIAPDPRPEQSQISVGRPDQANSMQPADAPLKRRHSRWLWYSAAALTLLACLGTFIYIATDNGTVKITGTDKKLDSPSQNAAGETKAATPAPRAASPEPNEHSDNKIHEGANPSTVRESKPRSSAPMVGSPVDLGGNMKHESPAPSTTSGTKSTSPTTKVSSPKSSPLNPGREWTNSIGMKLVRLVDGEFLMGTTKDQVDELTRLFPNSKREWFDDEQPQHPVKISRPFFLGIHEVTQGQYRAVMDANPSQFKGSDDLPVENVSWLDAVGFSNKLSEREKRTPFYRIDGTEVTIVGGNGYRLSTEAEWEYACRAKSANLFPFVQRTRQLDEHAWSTSNAESKTHPFGQKLPNAWGLYDMLGKRLGMVRGWV